MLSLLSDYPTRIFLSLTKSKCHVALKIEMLRKMPHLTDETWCSKCATHTEAGRPKNVGLERPEL